MRWRRIIAIVFGFWMWFYAPLFADPVTIKVLTPRMGMAPLYTVVLVRIDPHPDNRVLCFLWGLVEEGMYNSSCIELHGEQSKRSERFERDLRIPGTWNLIARIVRSDESVHAATDTVTAIGGP